MPDRFAVVVEDDLAEIRFDDGGMNLLSSEALVELSRRIDELPQNTRVLLFESGRRGIFAAGADMQEMRKFSAEDAAAFSGLGQDLFARIERLSMLTAAFIDGDCFGGALDLALAFDFRFATSRARFSHPGAKIGIVTGFGGTSRWRKTMTRAGAQRLFLESSVKDAEGAKATGLIDGIVHSVDRSALRGVDPVKVRVAKELLNHADGMTLDQIHLLARKLEELYSR